jgi:hypothetical protein
VYQIHAFGDVARTLPRRPVPRRRTGAHHTRERPLAR